VGISQVSKVQTRFDPHAMYLLSLDPVRAGYSPEKAEALFRELSRRLGTAGGVASVALAAQAPFSIQDEDSALQLTAEGSRVQIPAVEEPVGPGYFAALGEPLLAGREFGELDGRRPADGSNTLPALLNESAAQRLFGNGTAIGERINDGKQSYEIIGVVHDMRNGLWDSPSVVYLPLTHRDFGRPPADGITIMARAEAGTDAVSSIRREIEFMDPNLTILNLRTLSDSLERSRSSERFAVGTYGGIGAFGLVLAAIGLAGVTAYAVAQRRKEIGIRMALGARKGQALLLVLREGAALIIAGSVLGFLGAFALAKMLSTLTVVFVDSLKVSTGDPRLLVGAPLLLAGLALVACYVPARRAVRVDPLKTLREG